MRAYNCVLKTAECRANVEALPGVLGNRGKGYLFQRNRETMAKF